MVVYVGETQVFERQVAQLAHRVVGRERPLANLIQKAAYVSLVHRVQISKPWTGGRQLGLAQFSNGSEVGGASASRLFQGAEHQGSQKPLRHAALQISVIQLAPQHVAQA